MTIQIGLNHYLILGAILFALGLFGALGKRNGITILMCIEIMLNAVNLTFVALSRFVPARPLVPGAGAVDPQITGQIFAIFIITIAAAEAAVGLAIVMAIYRRRVSIDVERADLLKG